MTKEENILQTQVSVAAKDIFQWREDWLAENDPQDGKDCVTPFDKYLYTFALQPQADEKPLRITYTNWRGETSERTIRPISVYWGSTEWHPEPQWLLKAFDFEKNAERDFALKDFGSAPLPQTNVVAEDKTPATLWIDGGCRMTPPSPQTHVKGGDE